MMRGYQYISILHKYDYNVRVDNEQQGERLFQFYISTIITTEHVSVSVADRRFQFYISTIITWLRWRLWTWYRYFNST